MGSDGTPTAEVDGLPVRLRTIARGLRSPTGFAVPPDGDYRYLADQPGRILVHGPDGLAEEPFLDVSDRVVAGGERGLLGVAFHPDGDGRFYVRYSAPPRPGTPSGYSHTFVLAEFRAAGPERADPGSERTVLEIPEPQSNHNSGSLAFGPEGYLYVGVGDGGAGGDRGRGHAEGGNGQDVTENRLGSVLRIDVDERGGDRAYGIPDDNPLVGREGFDEHFAWGLRNPWGMSFDGDDLYVADVGQNRWEEVNVVENGGNYGWNVKEGTHCYDASTCPDTGPRDEPLLDPVVEYPHSGGPVSGITVIGGFVYRGSAVPGLHGRYVFGDLRANGRLFAATPADDGLWPTDVVEVHPDDRGKLGSLRAFGRGRSGELYVSGIGDEGGGVHEIVPS